MIVSVDDILVNLYTKIAFLSLKP